MTDANELRACPFCGSTEDAPIESVVHLCHNEWDREHNPGGDWWSVQCDSCTATMGQFDDPDKAIEAWNRRALIASRDGDDAGLVKRLRKPLEYATSPGGEGRNWMRHPDLLANRAVRNLAADRIETLTRELDKAREALKPFSLNQVVSNADFRRAADTFAALSATTDLGRDTENAG